MESNPTLHDFVLNLIMDQDARRAFELDPEGTLRDAGLGELTPADVQEVVPLVVDLVPAQGLTGLLPLGQGGDAGLLDVDQTGLVGQLTNITRQLGVPGLTPTANADLNVSTLGVITAGPGDLPVGLSTLDATGITTTNHEISVGTSGLDVTSDLSQTLDLESLSTGGVLPLDTGVLDATPLNSTLETTTSLTGGLTSDLTGGLGSTLDGLTSGDLSATTNAGLGTVDSLTGDLTGSLGLDRTVGGLTDGLTGGLTGNLTSNLTGGLTGSLGLGDAGVGTHVGGEAHATTGGGLLGGVTDGLLGG